MTAARRVALLVLPPLPVALAVALIAAPGAAQCPLQALAAAGVSASDGYGSALALHGDIALVGAPGDDTAGLDAGAVYVFERGPAGWSEVQQLLAPGAAAGDAFGRAVAVGGDFALVGAPGDDGAGADAGRVHAFQRIAGTWVATQDFAASSTAAGDNFGWAVAIAGSALVGAPFHDGGGADAGRSYSFVRTAAMPTVWTESSSGGNVTGTVAGEHVGWSVALRGTWAVGRPGTASVVTGFPSGGFPPTTTVNGPAGSRFGEAIALDPIDRMLVGAPLDDVGATDAGAAYMYVTHAWLGGLYKAGTFTAAVPTTGARFGCAVAVAGDFPPVDAIGEEGAPGESGSVHLFDRGLFGLQIGDPFLGELRATSWAAGDHFASALVAGEDGVVIVGAPGAGTALALADADPWTDLGFELPGPKGPPPDPTPRLHVAATGCGDLPVRVELLAQHQPSPTTAWLVVGLSEINAPFKGGVLVPAVDQIFGPLPLNGFLTVVGPFPTGVPAGTTITMQYWIPDPAGPAGFVATQAQRIVTP